MITTLVNVGVGYNLDKEEEKVQEEKLEKGDYQ
jgi:hypothetical protein